VKTSTSDGLHESRNEPRMSAKPLETASFAGETEHHLFRLKSRAKFNDINARFDSSCNVPVIEDQLLGAESKCDFRPRRRTSCIGAPQILISWLAYERKRHQSEGRLMPLSWVGRRDGGSG
jgi:hypothetical protein